ncbi:FHA domain-containing protein [Cellulomonas wangsupingiae]|uniref:FHA domain-containing protein n=1 Tax=Cellulomonas wangsupingiae TaxID=2968085 RepID=A0ABY5K100_9CELL|nr:FHA domain-containing protein [Cellulomonas wangsupingiae]MCC2333264.1 FHA domain-containing protein [Cellulomonas wangsupingiae]MCM0638117.1 FHA domain-containing protein [Cellulomonas wangsupingiae]UUI63468.1 FHA domain-containing protein [Cellulomonas wangsupingiae]
MSDDRRPASGGSPAYRGDGPDTTVSFGSLDPAELEVAPVGLTADEAAAVHALPPTSALLIMQRGPSAGARFLLDAERTTAGRSTSADIFLDDVTVSRKHAEFVRDGQQVVVRDIGSLNGTYVNRARIDAAVLRPGDEVQIGKYRMTFHPSPHRVAS